MQLNTSYMLDIVPLLNRAAIMTARLTFFGVLIALAVGVVGNIVYYYRIPVLSAFFAFYTELSRNTPIIAQLFFLFFGLPALGITLSGFVCGVIALGFLGGSYMLEAMRGGIEAVSHSQKETAASLGLSKSRILWHIIAPQAIRTSLPAIAANTIFLLRESSLIGVIAVPELMHVARSQIGMFFRTNEVLIMITLYYLLLIGPLSLVFMALERKLRLGGVKG